MRPGKLRRLGRESFTPNTKPEDLYPLSKYSWNYGGYLALFKEGWAEAEEEYKKHEAMFELEFDEQEIVGKNFTALVKEY